MSGGTPIQAVIAGLWTAILLASAPVSAGAETMDTSVYASVLSNRVDSSGLVDYSALRSDPAGLRRFLKGVADMSPPVYEKWSTSEQIAFWINAYNALVLDVIVRNYPVKPSLLISLIHPKNSIRQIAGVFDEVRFPVMGREMTLDEIEHKTLRKQYNEPRIHMALVCAARGCPPLRGKPYTGARLDQELEDQTRRFLANPKTFRIDRENGRVRLSFIFKWFGEDFARAYVVRRAFPTGTPTGRSVLFFISRHVDHDARAYLESGPYTVDYLDYDWSLNEQRTFVAGPAETAGLRTVTP